MFIDDAIKKLGKVLRNAGINFSGNATADEVFSAHHIKEPEDIAAIIKLAKDNSILDLALLSHNTAKKIQSGNLTKEEKEEAKKFARQLTVAQELKSIKADLDETVTETAKAQARQPVASKVGKSPKAGRARG
jgi:hypothetical protein